jgi:hypothetical protein
LSSQTKKLEGRPLNDWLSSQEGDWKLMPSPEGLFILQRIDEAVPRKGVNHLALCGEVVTQGGLTDMLNLVSNCRWTGVFHYVAENVLKAIVFQSGDVCSAQSTAPEDRLGESIYRQGILTREQVERAAKECPNESRLGGFLVKRQLITSHDLYSFIQRQVEEIFYSLLLASRGTFYFYRQDMLSATQATRLSLSTQDLLMTGVQRIDEMAYFREKIPSSSMVFELTGAANNEPAVQGETEQTVLALIDGRTDLESIGQTAHLGEFETVKAAFQLLQANTIRPLASDTLGGRGMAAKEQGLAEVISLFNEVFAKIFAEAQRQDREADLINAVGSFFHATNEYSTLFTDVGFRDDGTLDTEKLLENVSTLDGENQVDFLYQGLNEFLFFETFIAGETLDSKTEEQLHERLDEIILRKKQARPADGDVDLETIPSDIITFSF